MVASSYGAAGEERGGILPSRIEAELASHEQQVLGERLREPEALTRFYEGRAHTPAWLGPDGRLGEDARALRIAVERAERHGLHPESYHAGVLRRLGERPPPRGEYLAELDLVLSDAFLHLARHLSSGAVEPQSLHPGYERAGGPPSDPADVLTGALRAGRIVETLAEAAPPHPEYAALVLALERLRAQAAAVGTSTAADRIRANLERWRWLPRELGHRHLRVNIPAFGLRAFESGEPVLAMRVVVGKVGWETPLAHGVVSHLELNPSWQVPLSIATREMLPEARRDPGYFESSGIEVLVEEGGATREIDPR